MGDFIFDDKLLEELKKLTLYSDPIAKDNDIVTIDHVGLMKPASKHNKDYIDMAMDIFTKYYNNVPLVEEKPKLLEIKNTEKLGIRSNGTVKVISVLEDRYIIEFDNVFTKTFYFDLYREYLIDGSLLLKCTNTSFKNRSDIERRFDKDVLRNPHDFIRYLEEFVNKLNKL
jgi:hypothetical protein